MNTFFHGTEMTNGKRVRFLKALKAKRNRNEAILNGVAPDSEWEDILVLDKNALPDILSKSGAFYTIHQRKS
jgi:hypothetical protein